MASGLTIRKELVVNGLISDITIDWFASQLCILPSGQDELRIVQKKQRTAFLHPSFFTWRRKARSCL